MSTVFDSENLEAKDCGVFFNGNGDGFDVRVEMSFDEDGDLSLIFENDEAEVLSLSLPTERLLALLKAQQNAELNS